jgi:hypothetical protein
MLDKDDESSHLYFYYRDSLTKVEERDIPYINEYRSSSKLFVAIEDNSEILAVKTLDSSRTGLFEDAQKFVEFSTTCDGVTIKMMIVNYAVTTLKDKEQKDPRATYTGLTPGDECECLIYQFHHLSIDDVIVERYLTVRLGLAISIEKNILGEGSDFEKKFEEVNRVYAPGRNRNHGPTSHWSHLISKLSLDIYVKNGGNTRNLIVENGRRTPKFTAAARTPGDNSELLINLLIRNPNICAISF